MNEELKPIPVFLAKPQFATKQMVQTVEAADRTLIKVAAQKVLSGLTNALESVVALMSQVDPEVGHFHLEEFSFTVAITAEGEVGLKPIGSVGMSSAAEISVTFARKGKIT